GRAQTLGEPTRGAERHLLRSLNGLSVGSAAQGPAAEKHGVRLLRSVGLGRHAGAPSSHAVCGLPRAGRKRGKPNGCDYRYPERQGSAKRGASIDPQGYDAGKKITGRKRHIVVDTLGLMLGIVVRSAAV